MAEQVPLESVISTDVALPRMTEELQALFRLERGDEIDRYVVLETIASGESSTVYAAYDTELHRKIALKVLRRAESPEMAQHLRHDFLRQAQAMALISHPHVVRVHDMGEAKGVVFVAMEFIDGVSLGNWQIKSKRSWLDIVNVFVAAGSGLAAAEEAGVVPSMFALDNVLVCPDGRVYLTDVGLVRDEPASSFTWQQVQWSFCNALHAVLLSARDRSPRWIHHVIEKGRSAEPSLRYESMDRLVEALHSPPWFLRKPVRMTFVWSTLVVTALIAHFAFVTPPQALCRDADKQLVGVWDSDVKRRVTSAFAETQNPSGDKALAYVVRQLDAYATAWVNTSNESCEATHIRGEQTAAVSILRERCLDRRRSELKATIDILSHITTLGVDRAPDAVSLLSPSSECSAAQVALPPGEGVDGPARAEKLRAIQTTLAEVKTAIAHAMYDEAGRVLRQLDAEIAREHDNRGRAEWHYLSAMIERHNRDSKKAIAHYYEAAWRAQAASMERMSIRAWAALAYLETQVGGGFEAGQRAFRQAASLIDRIGQDDRLRGELQLSWGRALTKTGTFSEAEQSLAQARNLLSTAPGFSVRDGISLREAMAGLYAYEGRVNDAIVLQKEVIDAIKTEYGEHHRNLLDAYANLGAMYGYAGRADLSLEPARRAVELMELHHVVATASATALVNLSETLLSLDALDEAETYAQRALSLCQDQFPSAHAERAAALVALGSIARARQQLALAVEYHRSALKLIPNASSRAMARAQAALGLDLLEQGKANEALALFEQAKTSSVYSQGHVTQAELEFAMAKALVPQRASGDQIYALATSAIQIYQKYERSQKAQEVQAWVQHYSRMKKPAR